MILTACLIVRDEEEFLTECLQSIMRLTTDVVIVDTGSVDGTKEIAERLGCKVFSYEWQDDFSAARNYALQKVRGEWVLFIDADERVEWKSSRAELYALLANTECQAFRAPILSYVGSQRSVESLVSDERIVLFCNDPLVRFSHRVHEDLSESLVARYGLNLTIGHLPLVVEHLGYLDQVVERRSKHERNIRLLELEINEKGTSPWTDYCLGTEWSSCPEWEKAITPLDRVVRYAPQMPYWELAAYNLAYDYLQLGRNTQCMEICDLVIYSGKDLSNDWQLLKAIAGWLANPAIANMLAAWSDGATQLPTDYQAFLLAYQFALRRVFTIANF